MSSDPEPPFDLGKFYVLGRIGEGGTGVVYAAQLDDKLVALKVLRSDVTLTDREIKAFVAEGERAGRVRHLSLVPVLDVGTLPDGRPYLAMPKLEGESLATRLGAGPFTIARALALFEGLAGAVTALHEAKLLHRDIKPENVFLERSKSGGDERLVLLDLGIAREIDAPQSTTTQQGLVRGTPAYMAPERFFGAPASIRSDLYELAVVLVMMLTGELPWNPLDPKDRLSSVTEDALAARLPRALADTLAKALSMRTADRPSSAAELLDAVKVASGGAAPRATGQVQITPPSSAKLRRSEIAVLSRNDTQAAMPMVAKDESNATKRRGGGAIVGVIIALAIGAGLITFVHYRTAPTSAAASASAPASATASAPATAPAPATASAPAIETASASAPGTSSRSKIAKTSEAAVVAPPVVVSGDGLSNCHDLAAFYCSAEFQATEGTFKGQQCSSMRSMVATWASLPASTHADSNTRCVGLLAAGKGALAQRKADLASGRAPH